MSIFNKFMKSLPKQVEEVNDSEKNEVKSIIIKNSTPNCPYPVLEREILPEKITCPICGFLTIEGLERCDRCGSKITDRKDT